MKSVRLEPELEARLREAARREGVSKSALIRSAIAERCAAILGERPDIRLADVFGSVDLGGGRAEHTGKKFTELLRQRAARA